MSRDLIIMDPLVHLTTRVRIPMAVMEAQTITKTATSNGGVVGVP